MLLIGALAAAKIISREKNVPLQLVPKGFDKGSEVCPDVLP